MGVGTLLHSGHSRGGGGGGGAALSAINSASEVDKATQLLVFCLHHLQN